MRKPGMKLAFWILAIVAALTAAACHSSGIDVTIQNNAKVPLNNVEVDYPTAAFGARSIAPGASFWYHIKPTSDGEITLSFEQPDAKVIHQKEEHVHAGESGRLIIIVDQDANQQWHTRVEKK